MTKLLVVIVAFAAALGAVSFYSFRDTAQSPSPEIAQIAAPLASSPAPSEMIVIQSPKPKPPLSTLTASSPRAPTATPRPSLAPPQTLPPSPSPSRTPTPTVTTAATATQALIPTSTPTFTPTITPTPTFTATPAPTQTVILPSFAVEISLPVSQFRRGSIYAIIVQSLSNAFCFVEVYLPVTGNQSESAGVWDSANNKPITKSTDADGTASWDWRVGSSTKLGFATIKATCTLGDQTTSAQSEVEIIAAQ